MEKVQVTVSFDFDFSYDPNSPEFQECFKSFNEMMWPNSSEKDILQYLAQRLIAEYGADDMIEGIGYVSCPRLQQDTERDPNSGIFVDDDTPIPYFQ